jgi:valyl-tRNA synthetase
VIESLAKVELAIAEGDGTAPLGTVQAVFEDASLFLHVADVIDLAEQHDRLAREITKIEDEIAKLDKKLGNENFLARAPEAVVFEQRERRDEAEQSRLKLDRAMARLAGV